MKVTVEVSDMKISTKNGDFIVTYALGSCLGFTVYDPVANVAGMLHSQLPLSRVSPEKAKKNPCMFVDTGIPYLFEQAYKLGLKKERAIVKLTGCSHVGNKDSIYNIGERNYILARKLLWKNDVLISAEDVGGAMSRSLSLDVATGMLTVKSGKREVAI